jgi:hypothetical protein
MELDADVCAQRSAHLYQAFTYSESCLVAGYYSHYSEQYAALTTVMGRMLKPTIRAACDCTGHVLDKCQRFGVAVGHLNDAPREAAHKPIKRFVLTGGQVLAAKPRPSGWPAISPQSRDMPTHPPTHPVLLPLLLVAGRWLCDRGELPQPGRVLRSNAEVEVCPPE